MQTVTQITNWQSCNQKLTSANTETIFGRYWLFGPNSSLSDLQINRQLVQRKKICMTAWAYQKIEKSRVWPLTSQPLNKVDHAQLWPQSNHLLLANSLAMQELPANMTEHYKNINHHLNLKTTNQTQKELIIIMTNNLVS